MQLARITAIGIMIVALSTQLVAQERNGFPGGMAAFAARIMGPIVSKAADKNSNSEVTPAEWASFLAAVKGKTEGSLNMDSLKGALLSPALERNGDKKLTVADLQTIFDAKDTNKDKSLQKEELQSRWRGMRGGRRGGEGGSEGGRRRRGEGDRRERPDMKELLEKFDANGNGELDPEEREKARASLQGQRGQRGEGQRGERGEGQRGQRGRSSGGERQRRSMMDGIVDGLVIATADKDSSGDITQEEWKTFCARFATDKQGNFPTPALLAALLKTSKAQAKKAAEEAENAEGNEEGGRRFRGRGMFGGGMDAMITRLLDLNDDDAITSADLTELFEELDENEDKTLQKEELAPRSWSRGGQGRGRDI